MAFSDDKPDREGARRGSRVTAAEFAAQFQASFKLLWLVARGIVGDAGMAEDVVQEAALVALQKLDQFEPGTSFTAWMAQMVRYVALNESRRLRRRKASGLDGVEAEQGMQMNGSSGMNGALHLGPRGELPLDQNSFDDRLVAALSGVQGVARACLLLRTIEGMEYAEIARLLEIPEGTAMSHVHRARHYLRERLTDPVAAVPAPREVRT